MTAQGSHILLNSNCKEHFIWMLKVYLARTILKSQLRCCCQSLSWISSEAKRVIAKQVHKVFLMPNVWVSSTRCSYAMIWKGLEMKSWCQIFESHKIQSKWFFCQIATLWTIYREIWKVNKSVSETSLLHSNSKLCYFVAI